MSEQLKTKKKIFDLSLFLRLLFFVSPYKGKFYWSIFLAIFLAVLSPIRPWLIQLTINNGLKDNAAVWFLKGPVNVIIGITIIQLIILLIESVCRFIFSFFISSLGQNVLK